MTWTPPQRLKTWLGLRFKDLRLDLDLTSKTWDLTWTSETCEHVCHTHTHTHTHTLKYLVTGRKGIYYVLNWNTRLTHTWKVSFDGISFIFKLFSILLTNNISNTALYYALYRNIKNILCNFIIIHFIIIVSFIIVICVIILRFHKYILHFLLELDD